MVICHTLNNFYEMIHAPPHGMHYFIFSPLGAPNGLKFNFKYRKCIRGVELKILHGCLPYFYENQCATTRNTSRTKPSSKISICYPKTWACHHESAIPGRTSINNNAHIIKHFEIIINSRIKYIKYSIFTKRCT